MTYTKAQLSKILLELRDKLGRIPSRSDCSVKSTIAVHFGSWNNALQETFGEIIQVYGNPALEVTCLACNSRFKKSYCDTVQYPNHFCSRSCAATYNNKHKKHGTRRSKLEVWLEQELTKLYPELVFQFNSKEAIGSELDIYIPSLKLAFELNGIFHYEPIFGDKKLNQIQVNDQNKFQACQASGISLCILDVSGLSYFKPTNAQKYLVVIQDVINKRLGADVINP